MYESFFFYSGLAAWSLVVSAVASFGVVYLRDEARLYLYDRKMKKLAKDVKL